MNDIKSTNDDEPDEGTSKDDVNDEELNTDKWMVNKYVIDKCRGIKPNQLYGSYFSTVSYTAVC